MDGDRSLPDLTKDVALQISELFRNEVRLARAEAVDSAKRMAASSARVALGLSVAAGAVTLALFAIAYALGERMPMWAAGLIAAAIGALVAYLLVRSGTASLSTNTIALPKTAENVSRDLRSIKESFGS